MAEREGFNQAHPVPDRFAAPSASQMLPAFGRTLFRARTPPVNLWCIKKPPVLDVHLAVFMYGGEGGIRTLDTDKGILP